MSRLSLHLIKDGFKACLHSLCGIFTFFSCQFTMQYTLLCGNLHQCCQIAETLFHIYACHILILHQDKSNYV